MIRIAAVLVCFGLGSGTLQAQSSHSVSGTVTAVDTGGPLAGALVRIPQSNRTAVTGADGWFELTSVPSGLVRLQFRHLGYEPVDTLIRLSGDVRLAIRLSPRVFDLSSITVEEQAIESDLSTQTPLSTVYVPQSRIRQSVRLAGEPDPIRYVQTLPGVKTESDFSGGYSVRGGRNDQNLILFDGMPVYSPWHLFGLFSAFNAQSVSGLEFSKGVFSPRYGSRISSVMHLYATDGSNAKGLDELNVGMVSSSLTAGLPYSDKGSVYLSMRRTYMDPFLAAFDRQEKAAEQQTLYYFHDLSAKWKHVWSPRWESDGLVIHGKDRFRFRSADSGSEITDPQDGDYETFDDANRTALTWQNTGASLCTRYKDEALQIEAQTYLSSYRSVSIDSTDFLFDFQTTERYLLSSRVLTEQIREQRDYELKKRFDQDILDLGARVRGTWSPSAFFRMDAGLETVRHRFEDRGTLDERTQITTFEVVTGFPSRTLIDESELSRLVRADIASQLTAIHAGVSLETARWSLHPGLRVETYSFGSHTAMLPRINGITHLTADWSLTAGYGWFRQYVQAVGIDLLQVPVEKWIWASPTVDPLEGRTLTIGTRYRMTDESAITIEAYQRRSENLLALDPVEVYLAVGGTGTFVPVYRDITVVGEGKALGVETILEATKGRFTGKATYTLSRSQNRFPSINNGRWFDARTDSRHDASADLTYRSGRSWIFGAQFRFKSGQPITMAYSGYDRVDDPLGIGNEFDNPPLIWNEKHNYRLPDYHRLDVFATWQSRPFGRYSADLTFSVINLYNRFNVLAVNTTTTVLRTRSEASVTPKHRFLGQLPVFPMVSIRIHTPS